MTDAQTPNSGRMMLLLIGGIPVTIMLAATWFWYFGIRGNYDIVDMLGTANRGQLVQPPLQIDDQVLRDQHGEPLQYADLPPRWSMLVPSPGATCAASCEKTLYLTRQIHVAMGKEFNRIRRLYVSEQAPATTSLGVAQLSDERPLPATFTGFLATEHRGVQPLQLEAGVFEGLFPRYATDPSTWYLVDPAGWIMMSYNNDVPYKDVIADLKFLLKNSGG